MSKLIPAPTATPTIAFIIPTNAAVRKNPTPLLTSVRMRAIGHPTAATGMKNHPRGNRPATKPIASIVGTTQPLYDQELEFPPLAEHGSGPREDKEFPPSPLPPPTIAPTERTCQGDDS